MKPSTNHPTVNRTGPATAPSAIQLAAGRSDRIAIAALGRLRSVTIGVTSLLGQAHLEADSLGADGTVPKRALGGESFELARRVGAALEHFERPLRREGTHPSQVHG